jgi:Holliday junction resolvase RusA-like endonuclease
MITFEIPGAPFGKERPRATRTGRVYTPAKTVSFERMVGTLAMPHFTAPIEGPVRLEIRAVFALPESWSRKKKDAHINRPHTQRPDADNIAKAIKDGMNRIAWADDSQVAEMTVTKHWGPAPKTLVIVEALNAL